MTYKVSDILDPTPISGNTLVKNFVNRCKENLDAKKNQKETRNLITSLNSITDEIFCFESNDNGNKQICLSRKFSEKNIKPSVDNKTTIAKDKLKNLIKKVSGYSDRELSETDFFNFNGENIGKSTTLKQEFVCFTIHYFFRNPRNTIYDFLHHLQSNTNISIGDLSKLNIQSKTDLKRFKVFAYDMNYSFVADAVGVSKTIIAQKYKLNLKSNLRAYVIGEEKSCSHLKDNPFNIIKSNETSYYSKADKLTTADIFLYDTSDKQFYKNTVGSFRKRTLNHEQYRSFINKSFTEGAIIPISLKQLILPKKQENHLNKNFVTTKIKVIGSYDLGEKKRHLEDDFMKSAIELFSTKNKQDFYKKLNSLIDIDISSAKLATEGTTVEFYAKFSPSSTLIPDGLGGLPYIQSGRGQRYKLWMTVGQIHIMPEKSLSGSGLGGVSRESLFEDVIKKLPKTTKFLNKLIKCRQNAFGTYYNNIAELQQKKMLTGGSFTPSSKSEFAKVFNQLPSSQLYDYLFAYVDEMQKMMKRGFPKMTRQQFMNQRQVYLAHKMSQMEMIFYILSNTNIVKDWIKKSFIMSIYAAVSATGIIIFDGKHINMKKFGRSAMKQTSRLNPVYVKIGY